MKMLQEYWASTVIFIGIFSQCTCHPKNEILLVLYVVGKKNCEQSGRPLKFLRLSEIDCAKSELRLLMSGISFSVIRYVTSRRVLYDFTPTASLLTSFARRNRAYQYQKFDDFW